MKKIHFIEMNKYVKVDVQSLLISSNKWITNGADNDYFYVVEEAYLGSPTNQSIIDNFTNYILGEGLEDISGSVDISTILGEEDLRNAVTDFKMQGACAFQVIYNFGGSVSKLYYVPTKSLAVNREEDITDDPEYIKWLTMLVNPGSSLGGARPKASVLDDKKNLWIAKFPSRTDIKDIGGWEMVANEIARNAGLNVAISKIQKFSSRYYTFLTKRFDRTDNGERIHYASAMTMLGYKDGDSFQEGVSYLEIVDFLTNNGASIDKDLKELWSRIVFNIFISNTDDHLRNHGFILTDKGWILSPAYDINPNEDGAGLSLNIDLDDNSLTLDLPLKVLEYFRLNKDDGLIIIDRIRKAVTDWRRIANRYQLPKSEQEIMAKVFERFLKK